MGTILMGTTLVQAQESNVTRISELQAKQAFQYLHNKLRFERYLECAKGAKGAACTKRLPQVEKSIKIKEKSDHYQRTLPYNRQNQE